MKLKLKIFILALFSIYICSQAQANNIFFDSKNIKIENDGNIIYSTYGTAKVPDEDIIIKGDKSIYNKLIS